MTNENSTPRCPRCGNVGHQSGAIYFCRRCAAWYDDDPDEGSPTTYNDPMKSLEAKEREERRKKPRR